MFRYSISSRLRASSAEWESASRIILSISSLLRPDDEVIVIFCSRPVPMSFAETFLGGITTGASNDIEKATELARAMVCEYGMSELGPLTFGKKEEQIFLGREIAQHRDYSEETSIRIDSEVRKIVTEQYERATKIIQENRDTLVRLADELLEHESLDGVQIRRIVAGLPFDDGEAPSTASEDEPQ